MGACREMRLPRSESESQSMSPFSGALDSLAADAPAAAPPAAEGQSSSTSTEDRCFAGFACAGFARRRRLRVSCRGSAGAGRPRAIARSRPR